jgi:hypothetical protein
LKIRESRREEHSQADEPVLDQLFAHFDHVKLKISKNKRDDFHRFRRYRENRLYPLDIAKPLGYFIKVIIGGIAFYNQEIIKILQGRQHKQFAIAVGCQEKIGTQMLVVMPEKREPGYTL